MFDLFFVLDLNALKSNVSNLLLPLVAEGARAVNLEILISPILTDTLNRFFFQFIHVVISKSSYMCVVTYLSINSFLYPFYYFWLSDLSFTRLFIYSFTCLFFTYLFISSRKHILINFFPIRLEAIKSFYEQVQINPSSEKVAKVKQVFDMLVCSTCFKIPQQICVFLIPCGVTPMHHINKTFEPFQH